MGEALKPLVSQWIAKITEAAKHKKAEFQDDADECARFLDGPYDWLYSPRGRGLSSGFDVDTLDLRPPSVRITINKTAELVQLFGPAIYHRNPVRKVNPRKIVEPPPGMIAQMVPQPPPMQPGMDPMVAQQIAQQMAMQQQMVQEQIGMQLAQAVETDRSRAEILEKYLNYTPSALDLKTHSRWAMTEALIKGMGLLWTRPHRPAGSMQNWVGSFYDSVDNLQMDPDATCMQDVKWVARRCCHPVWEVERKYGYQPGTLKPTPGLETHATAATVSADPEQDYRRRQGRTADLLVYWEIYSKMGMGGRLLGVPQEQRQVFDLLGDFVYLAIAETT